MNNETPLLLLVDDKPDNLDLLINYLENAGMRLSVALSGEDTLELVRGQVPDLILLDIMMPGLDGFETCLRLKKNPRTRDIPVIFMSALSDTVDKVKGFEAGGVDYLTKPLEQAEVLARVNAHLTIRRQQQDLERKNRELAQEIKRRNAAEDAFKQADARLSALSTQEAKRWGIDAFVGNSPRILAILGEVRKLQQRDKTTTLILGESGTGKELIARAIHFGSARAKGSFVAVNCSAVPTELADAGFFGHVKGAFTGALGKHQGYFEQADGGTLFLDEIGDMPLLLQTKLLRTLENQTFTPVGGNREQRVNVRVIAATNTDLETRIGTREFRSDLYFRLAGYIIRLPALRERKEDIPVLVQHFLAHFSKKPTNNQGITPEALAALRDYEYPGNIRELKNLIEYALISNGGGVIHASHLHFMPTVAVPVSHSLSASPSLVEKETHQESVIAYLRKHPQISNSQCQRLLGISHNRASYLLKKLHHEGRLQKKGERRWTVYTL